MQKVHFEEALERILANDQRYDPRAYYFVREALDFTINLYSKPLQGPERHVRGEELLDGIRQFALKEFGPLAKTVLNRWGIWHTEDFGNIVFNLVESKVLGQSEQDTIQDFDNGYDFDEAFRAPFRPQHSVHPPSSPEDSKIDSSL